MKPAPDSLREAMAAIGTTAAGTVYIGDSDVDIDTAKNAGTAWLSVTWGFRDEDFLRSHGGTVFIHDAQELQRWLLSPSR